MFFLPLCLSRILICISSMGRFTFATFFFLSSFSCEMICRIIMRYIVLLSHNEFDTFRCKKQNKTKRKTKVNDDENETKRRRRRRQLRKHFVRIKKKSKERCAILVVVVVVFVQLSHELLLGNMMPVIGRWTVIDMYSGGLKSKIACYMFVFSFVCFAQCWRFDTK